MKKEQAIKECETLKRCLMQYSDEPNNIKSGQAIETVLNMLKEKDKEIKTLTQTNKSYKGIINKKDRQIDLMARAFKQDDVRTVEEIKQYFERKAKDGRN